ncbi:MAG: phenylalanine--tRNA ligase subunit beta [Candidatus Levybacteria bacterium RIFCSPLOWO2_01_FULL_36_13]|nr:MAG: phenylalanine--tRNA ligase subunit beta [Candidatus Levybacteria bacterium RIFCSPHIGHO2_01_FULL_36_15b]OGH35504.1 MAG: phenylalanine--tRNA ligase subunit beta [Candidatus Levybacteria bacterium RIFCSPLOWO2_01_FULL_36_13]
MNILIPESWLREYLETKASTKQIASVLSQTSVSVEKIQKINEDFVYDIEVTTNRPDLMSVTGVAREANVGLYNEQIETKFSPFKIELLAKSTDSFPIEVKNDSTIVNRICAIVMTVKVRKSSKIISDRLEACGIRSLNNIIDITNYVMRETGHPTHVFDLDRLNTKYLTITRSQKGEEITTLDGKTHFLFGDDIIAKDENGRIVDLLGVMGSQNSVITENTKRILFFVDNNNPINIRNTSMNLGIRTEAAILNEKGIDPNLAMTALLRGIELYQKHADGKIESKILDIYPNKREQKSIKITNKKITDVIGVDIPLNKSRQILEKLGFEVNEVKETLEVKVPSLRGDMEIEEDIIEEIARIYGYQNLPSIIPSFFNNRPYKFHDSFYFENKIKTAMKYLGFNEVYTYSLVSEEKFEGPIENALKIKNPLSIDMQYMRNSLVPSLLQVIDENKGINEIKIFELSNTYEKKTGDLPKETLMFSGIIKKENADFYEVKGLIEEVLKDIGITDLIFKNSKRAGIGASILKGDEFLGEIEILDTNLIDFELSFATLLKLANTKKVYKPLAKFPAIHEDISIISTLDTEEIINQIGSVNKIINEVYLKDSYNESRTFHITYRDFDKNLTKEDVSKVRLEILKILKDKLKAQVRE